MKRSKIEGKEDKAYRKKHKFINRYAKGIKLDARTKGCCYVTMQTNAGLLTVYIDSMDGSDDAPLINCLLYTSPSPRDGLLSRMPSSA